MIDERWAMTEGGQGLNCGCHRWINVIYDKFLVPTLRVGMPSWTLRVLATGEERPAPGGRQAGEMPRLAPWAGSGRRRGASRTAFPRRTVGTSEPLARPSASSHQPSAIPH